MGGGAVVGVAEGEGNDARIPPAAGNPAGGDEGEGDDVAIVGGGDATAAEAADNAAATG